MTTQTKQGQQWTPEPWTVDGWDLWHRGKDYNDPDDQHIFTGITTHKGCLTPTAKACLDRAAACVNACAGMTDPQAEIARLTHSDPIGLIASLQKEVERKDNAAADMALQITTLTKQVEQLQEVLLDARHCITPTGQDTKSDRALKAIDKILRETTP